MCQNTVGYTEQKGVNETCSHGCSMKEPAIARQMVISLAGDLMVDSCLETCGSHETEQEIRVCVGGLPPGRWI